MPLFIWLLTRSASNFLGRAFSCSNAFRCLMLLVAICPKCLRQAYMVASLNGGITDLVLLGCLGHAIEVRLLVVAKLNVQLFHSR